MSNESNELGPIWFQAAVVAAMGLKEQIVATRGVGNDILPFLDLRRIDDPDPIIVSLPGHLRRNEVIPWSIAAHAPDFVTLIDEAYQYIGEGIEDNARFFGSYRHGDLAQRFAAGDKAVSETLLIVGTDGEMVYQAWQPYRYEDSAVKWLEPDKVFQREDASFEGAVFQSMAEGFDMLRSDYPRDDALRRLEKLGAQAMTTDDLIAEQARIIFRAARNEPCPCGSGQKFKRCHGL